MRQKRLHSRRSGRVWALAEKQHGVVSRAQLLELGVHSDAITHRIATRRLHPVRRGVYALGRPQLTRHGRWMAALLSCGPDAVLSHRSAAALWQISAERPGRIDISLPAHSFRRRGGIVVHRRTLTAEEVTKRDGIALTAPLRTLIDLALCLSRRQLEAAINEADKRGLLDPEALRAAVGEMSGRRGVAALREILDRRTFALTDSELERRFLPIARAAGLPIPRTQCVVNGFRVDFYWPELGLVVETDGLRYHRTPAQQAADRIRDQAHTAAGLTPLRFPHAQIRYEPAHVRATLSTVSRRLRATKLKPG